MKLSISLRGVREAVGLFGLQMYTSVLDVPVRANMASRSCAKVAVRGTDMIYAPAERAKWSIDSNVGEARMSCLPGPRNAATARRRISDDPQPSSICSVFTLWARAILSISPSYSLNG